MILFVLGIVWAVAVPLTCFSLWWLVREEWQERRRYSVVRQNLNP